MTLTEKIIKEHYDRAIFWLKPAGLDYCEAVLKEKDTNICMKSLTMITRRYPLDCKYLEPNYDFPTLTKCNYHEKK